MIDHVERLLFSFLLILFLDSSSCKLTQFDVI